MKKNTRRLLLAAALLITALVFSFGFLKTNPLEEEDLLRKINVGMSGEEVERVLGKSNSGILQEGNSRTKFWTREKGSIYVRFSLKWQVIDADYMEKESPTFFDKIKKMIGL